MEALRWRLKRWWRQFHRRPVPIDEVWNADFLKALEFKMTMPVEDAFSGFGDTYHYRKPEVTEDE